VALVSAGVLLALDGLLGLMPAVALAMLASVLLTGAFHEDGLADTADGFGPVGSREQALAAMKDSRLGVFGTLALLFVLGSKFLALAAFGQASLAAIALFIAHPLSRLAALAMIVTQPYVSHRASRARDVAEGMPAAGWLLALPAGLLPLLWLSPCSALIVVLVTSGVLATLTLLGGYTGDVLGCVQQLTELAILLALVAVWRG